LVLAVDRGNELRGKIQREISFAARDHLRGISIRGRLEIANIRQAFGAQQLLSGILRSKTDAGIAHQSDRGRLQQPLRSPHLWRANEGRTASHRERRQNAASSVHHWHWDSSLEPTPSARA
jgi:hypothetical protein